MALDPRTPVCIGVAAATQRSEDPADGVDAAGLMLAAARAAAADSGAPGVLARVQLVGVAAGSWGYANAPRLIAEGIGAPGARTHLIALGVLQSGLFDRALSAIARGELDVALVCGGEAQYRELRGRITGSPASVTDDRGAPPPDEVVTPHGHVISPLEIARRMYDAPTHYAMLETARRIADGQSVEQHRAIVSELWSRFSAVAITNKDAWNRTPMLPDHIAATGPKNRLIAHPYSKWHVSQQNVDQAGAFLLCSVATAEALGVARDRWVFPHAIVDSNHMVPITQRALMHRSPGFAVAGARALELAGAGIDDIVHVDLYSCFPIAVRTQARELGLGTDRRLTVTGGMTFGGGPFGNYVLQSTAKMLEVLRADPGSRGLVTAISGMITKQGVCIWSTEPPAAGYRSADVSAEAAAVTPEVPTVDAVEASGSVLTWTVNADADGPSRALALVDLGDGTRALVESTDRALAAHLVAHDIAGAQVACRADSSFELV